MTSNKPANNELWTPRYSLEFLLGMEFFHERYGTGEVCEIDDERECCSVRFKGVIKMEISVSALCDPKKPWHIDKAALQKAFCEYRSHIDSLQEKFDGAKQAIEDLQLEIRWNEVMTVILAPTNVAIILPTDEANLRHQ